IFGLAAGVTTGLTLGAVSLFFKSYGGYSNFGLLLALQALQMPFAMGSATLLGIFQGRRLFRPLALLTMFQSALGLVLTIGLLANGQGLIGVMIASASGAIAFFGILLALNCKSVVPTRAGDFVEDFRYLVASALHWPLWASWDRDSSSLGDRSLVSSSVRLPSALMKSHSSFWEGRALWAASGRSPRRSPGWAGQKLVCESPPWEQCVWQSFR